MKRIVVLSDGTGNSSGKIFRTNVWRFYQALDLSGPDQVAHYDDGVGSSSFKPWALIAGAVGWGLKRNILDLYMFLCRNYELDDKGEPLADIYGLGFSRGAFTIRVLMNFVLTQGLVADATSEDDLKYKARLLYRQFRQSRKTRFGLVTLGRHLRDAVEVVRSLVVRQELPKLPKTIPVKKIRFIGVWDTVDAYGLPVAELKRGIDQYLWPLALDDKNLSRQVEKACHAISIDDRRKTFHPLLWDETGVATHAHTDDETLVQVWFAGAHANVGGGYPDDALSHVPLNWMIQEAQKQDLTFDDTALNNIRAVLSPLGKLNNPRAGLGTYYRYEPRWMNTPQDRQGACIPCPKIHESVILRIQAGTDDYAPVTFPANPLIVTEQLHEKCAVPDRNLFTLAEYLQLVEVAASAPNAQKSPPLPAIKIPSDETLRLIWDTIWWKRVIYFASTIATLMLIALPLLPPASNRLEFFYQSIPYLLLGLVKPFEFLWQPAVEIILGLIRAFLPKPAESWFNEIVESRGSLSLVVTIAGLGLVGALLDRRIQDRALAAWDPKWSERRHLWFRQSVRSRLTTAIISLVVCAGFLIWSLSILAKVLSDWRRHGLRCTWANGPCDVYQQVRWFMVAFEDSVIGGVFMWFGWALVAVIVPVSIWSIAYTVRALARKDEAKVEVPGLSLWISRCLREARISRYLYKFVNDRLLPIAAAVVVVLGILVGANRIAIAFLENHDMLCPKGSRAGQHAGYQQHGDVIGVTFQFSDACAYVNLEWQATYLVEYSTKDRSNGAWDIDALKAKSPIPTAFYSVPFFRRNLANGWFEPIIRIQSATGTVDRKVPYLGTRIEADLYPVRIFINDGVLGIRSLWNVFYKDNSGEGVMMFKKLPRAPAPKIDDNIKYKFTGN